MVYWRIRDIFRARGPHVHIFMTCIYVYMCVCIYSVLTWAGLTYLRARGRHVRYIVLYYQVYYLHSTCVMCIYTLYIGFITLPLRLTQNKGRSVLEPKDFFFLIITAASHVRVGIVCVCVYVFVCTYTYYRFHLLWPHIFIKLGICPFFAPVWD